MSVMVAIIPFSSAFVASRVRGVALVCCALCFTAAAARADDCDALSYRRNAIYKDAGYCFKTAAQIRNFGNAGCRFDDQADVPLSARQRSEIAEIVREERAYGCR
jgi:hypothetical protein